MADWSLLANYSVSPYTEALGMYAEGDKRGVLSRFRELRSTVQAAGMPMSREERSFWAAQCALLIALEERSLAQAIEELCAYENGPEAREADSDSRLRRAGEIRRKDGCGVTCQGSQSGRLVLRYLQERPVGTLTVICEEVRTHPELADLFPTHAPHSAPTPVEGAARPRPRADLASVGEALQQEEVCSGSAVTERVAELSRDLPDGQHVVVLGEDTSRGRDLVALGLPDFPETVSRAESIRFTEWLERRRAELEEDGSLDDVKGTWPAEAPEKMILRAHLEIKSDQFRGKVPIVQVACGRSWELPALFCFGGWNECPEPEVQVAAMKYWQEKYGARLVGLWNDAFECAVDRPPTTRDEAQQLALEQYIFCPDIVEQGTGVYRASGTDAAKRCGLVFLVGLTRLPRVSLSLAGAIA